MVEELRNAINRYKHLLKGGEIDYDKTLLVEEIEEELIENAKRNDEIIKILDNNELTTALAKLTEKLREDYVRVSEKLGHRLTNFDEALEAFLTGKKDVPGFNIIFIIIQAYARLKAQLYEEEKGNINNSTAECPVCGAISRTMLKEDERTYSMICPFCGYKWIVSTNGLRCPYCGNTDKLAIGVFTGKKLKRLGLAWCQSCGETWRVVLDKGIKVPRLFLTALSFGAEIYRNAIPRDADVTDS
ncbi:MAG: formate dehydrogenase accessory protein FdhE [Desulfurococcales archaeon]|nr:formate dehydrogenase accessory protein FdhE [Desulfurococcales archaeon]